MGALVPRGRAPAGGSRRARRIADAGDVGETGLTCGTSRPARPRAAVPQGSRAGTSKQQRGHAAASARRTSEHGIEDPPPAGRVGEQHVEGVRQRQRARIRAHRQRAARAGRLASQPARSGGGAPRATSARRGQADDLRLRPARLHRATGAAVRNRGRARAPGSAPPTPDRRVVQRFQQGALPPRAATRPQLRSWRRSAKRVTWRASNTGARHARPRRGNPATHSTASAWGERRMPGIARLDESARGRETAHCCMARGSARRSRRPPIHRLGVRANRQRGMPSPVFNTSRPSASTRGEGSPCAHQQRRSSSRMWSGQMPAVDGRAVKRRPSAKPLEDGSRHAQRQSSATTNFRGGAVANAGCGPAPVAAACSATSPPSDQP